MAKAGTKAFERQADDVPESVKKGKSSSAKAQAGASLEGNRRFVGSRQQVLVEGLSTRDERQAVARARWSCRLPAGRCAIGL